MLVIYQNAVIWLFLFSSKSVKIIHQMKREIVGDRYLKKSKKYYNLATVRKDKQNLIQGDIDSIVKKLCEPQNLDRITESCRPSRKIRQALSFSHSISMRMAKEKMELGVNSMHFFGKSRMDIVEKKNLKREVMHHINKIRKNTKSKFSMYQEYVQLSQETSDYIEYYLTNFTQEKSGKAVQMLKEQGKNIILLVFRKNFKFFDTNPSDINQRIFLAFNLNPMNDFQFITWEKFMRMRRLISCEFNRRECNQFVFDYFFLNEEKTLKGSQFWAIFKSVLRKLSVCLDGNGLEVLIHKIMDEGSKIIPQDHIFKKDELRKIIMDQPLFIWNQFVILVFS